MSDINPDVPDKPIEVPASPAGDQAATFGRDAIIVLSALPALIGVFGTHDVTTIVAFITSQQFAPALGIIILAGTVGWRQWKARKRHANEVKMATASPNSTAIVKGN